MQGCVFWATEAERWSCIGGQLTPHFYAEVCDVLWEFAGNCFICNERQMAI
jgi:hypothetical protein